MITQVRRLLGLLLLAPTLGCNVVQSTHVTKFPLGEGTPKALSCSGGAGAYKLSRSLLAASITYKADANKVVGPTFNGLTVTHIGDNNHQYCAEYEGSALSHDIVRINKTPDETLSLVTSRSLDQSRFIIETLIQIVFTAVTGAPVADVRAAALPGNTEIKFLGEFDPFDYQDTARFNDRANDFGYCVLIPEYAFDLEAAGVAEYCEKPLQTVGDHPPMWKQQAVRDADTVQTGTYPRLGPVTNEEHLKGVLYRPRVAHTIYLMNKQGKKWIIKSRDAAMLENVSPILSAALERAALAERATALQFHNGALMNVCSYNSAGITEFVKIPIVLARAILQAPAQIVRVKSRDVELERKLAEAETNLAKTRLQLLQLEEDATSLPSDPGPVTLPPAVGAFNQGKPSTFDAEGEKFVKKADGLLGSDCPAIDQNATFGLKPLSEVPGFVEDEKIIRAPSLSRN